MGIWSRLKPLDGGVGKAEHSLPKTLSWPHLIAMGIGAIIGMGIFTLTGIGASLAGPGVILSFALAGAVCALSALAYAEVATLIPTSGSAYTYTYSTLGEPLAWIIGWSLILEYGLGDSAVAVGWAAHMNGLLDGVMGIHLPKILAVSFAEGGGINLLAVLIVLAVTGLLLIGTKESATVNMVLVVVKLVALGAFILITLPSIETHNYHPFMPFGFWSHEVGGQKAGVMAAAAIMFFAFYGFDTVSTSAEETKNPARDLTIGILGSMLICTLFYMLVSACVVGVLPYTEVAKSAGEPLPYILRLLGHPIIGSLVGGAAILALPSVLVVFMYGQIRILFVMARDGLVPDSMSKLNKRGIPARMTIVTGILVAGVAGFVPLQQIAEMANTGTLSAFIAVSSAMILLRIRRPDLPRVFRVPVYWLIGPLSIAGCLFLFGSLNSITIIYFFSWNAIGLVLYFLYGMRHSRLAAQPA